jgi:hypothetical protein
MKNEYYNSYSAQFPIRDGHDWGRNPTRARDWDGAKCKDCGLVATNMQIALSRAGLRHEVILPACTK